VSIDVSNGVNYVYWNCPKKFIPNAIYAWYEEYMYQKNFPSAPMPAYKDVSNKFLMAYTLYEATLAEYKELMRE